MPLRVIGAGYGRTGTASTRAALNQLGFPCYHMAEVRKQRQGGGSHLDFWHDVSKTPEGTAHDWEKVFADYTATVDFPAACVWRELMEAYPDAKVLLTEHPKGPEAWVSSVLSTIYFTENMWQFRFLRLITPSARKFGDMCGRLLWQRSLRGTMKDRAAAVEQYKRHIEEVKAAVPADRLLVFSVDQGWEPLCAFLGVPVPDTPFPNVNERADMMRILARTKTRAYKLIGVLAAILAVAALGMSLAAG